jgi:hypothetical protein
MHRWQLWAATKKHAHAESHKAIANPEERIDQVGQAHWQIDGGAAAATDDCEHGAQGGAIVGNGDDVGGEAPAVEES